MADLPEKLTALGISIRTWREGNIKTTCPRCSHERRKRDDPCLSVRIEPGKVLVNCFHCGWKTAIFEDERNDEHLGRGRRLGRRPRHQQLDVGAARRRQRYGIDAP